MKQNRHTVDQIIAKLRRADVELGKGKTVPDACKVLGISEQTYYRWRQKYGGMQPEMAKELKALQKENTRLKKMVAEQALDMEILKEAAKGNWLSIKHPEQQYIQIDTTNILFICGGTFVGIEDIVRRRIGGQTLGFG